MLIEKLYAQLTGEKGDVFDNGKSDPPLLILGQLNNSGKERLGQEFDTDNCNGQTCRQAFGPEAAVLTLVYKFQLGNNVQADIGVFVFKHLKEHRKKMGDSPEQQSQRDLLWLKS